MVFWFDLKKNAWPYNNENKWVKYVCTVILLNEYKKRKEQNQ